MHRQPCFDGLMVGGARLGRACPTLRATSKLTLNSRLTVAEFARIRPGCGDLPTTHVTFRSTTVKCRLAGVICAITGQGSHAVATTRPDGLEPLVAELRRLIAGARVPPGRFSGGDPLGPRGARGGPEFYRHLGLLTAPAARAAGREPPSPLGHRPLLP